MAVTFSLATFNLYNLNESGLPIYGREGWSESDYNRKIAFTARILTELTSDVWGFQELWHEASLTAALDQAGLLHNGIHIDVGDEVAPERGFRK